MNSVDAGQEKSMNLGCSDESPEPEGEKSDEENTANSAYAGMNKFGPLAEEYDWNEDYNNPQYNSWGSGEYGPPGLHSAQGFYTLRKIDDEKHEECGEECNCGFQKKETKWEKKNRLREEAFKKSNKPGEVLSVGKMGKSDWIEIDAIVDSGAVDTIAPKSMVDGLNIRQTEISKRNGKYASADGGVIQNLGECDMEGIAEDGTRMKLVTQVGDKIMNMLISVRRMVESGNMVVFGANHQAIRKLAACSKIEKNMIVGKGGQRTEIKDEDGMYVYKMRIKKGKNDMDLGNVNSGRNSTNCAGVDYSIEDPF